MHTEHAEGWIFFFEAAQNFVHQIYSRVKNEKTYYVGSWSRTASAKKKKNHIHNWIRTLLCLAQCCRSTSLWCGSGLDLLPWCRSGSGSGFFFFTHMLFWICIQLFTLIRIWIQILASKIFFVQIMLVRIWEVHKNTDSDPQHGD